MEDIDKKHAAEELEASNTDTPEKSPANILDEKLRPDPEYVLYRDKLLSDPIFLTTMAERVASIINDAREMVASKRAPQVQMRLYREEPDHEYTGIVTVIATPAGERGYEYRVETPQEDNPEVLEETSNLTPSARQAINSWLDHLEAGVDETFYLALYRVHEDYVVDNEAGEETGELGGEGADEKVEH